MTATLSPNDATATFAWQSAAAAAGPFSDIQGATERTLILSEELSGKFVRVTATGSGEYTGTVESTATSEVQPSES